MIRPTSKFEKVHILLLAAVVLGLVLRLYGIRWGLPDAAHPGYSYHPDETLNLVWARWLVEGHIIPKQFIYGGTFYYTIVNSYSYYGERLGDLLGGFNHLANSILIGRYFHTLVAVLTIVIVYQCGRVFYGKLTGISAAIMLAVMPAHILCAQRIRPDELTALFSATMILFSWFLISAEDEKKIRYYIFAGLTLGMAVAFRFPLAILVGAPLAAHVFTGNGKNVIGILRSLRDRKLAIMLGVAVLGYTITTPHTFIYPEAFMQGLQVQWWYQSNPFMDAVGKGPGVYQYGWSMLHEALGYPLYFLALCGVVLALIRRSQADIIILVVGLPYFILTTFTSWVVVRYMLPLLPLLAILAGRFVAFILEEIPRYKLLAYATIGMMLGLTVLADYAYLKVEAGKDVRDLVTEWIQQSIPRDSSIVIVSTYDGDYYFNPVIPENYDAIMFPLTARNDSRLLFRDYKFNYLILHEIIYKNMERLGQRHPYQHHRVFYDSLMNSHYKQIREFKQPIEALGMDFSTWFTAHDYVIANPEIRIYKYQG